MPQERHCSQYKGVVKSKKKISQVLIRKRIYSANRPQTAVNNIWFKKRHTNSHGKLTTALEGISVSPFSICEQVLLNTDRVVIQSAKENSERISYWPSRDIDNEISNERLYLLAKDGPRHGKFGETVQRMPTGSKGSTGKNSTMANDRCAMDPIAYQLCRASK